MESLVRYQPLEEEGRDYHGLSWLSIQHLANRISYFVNDYKHRRITGPPLAVAIEACTR